jgi:uncharacterized protein affecting Mg2+/Co2+ transport
MIIGKQYKYSTGIITYLGLKNIPIAGQLMPHYEFITQNGNKFMMTIKEFERLKLQEVI